MREPHCKAVFGRKFCPIKIGPQNGGFLELRGVNVKFVFYNPGQGTSLRGTVLFDVLRVKIGSRA